MRYVSIDLETTGIDASHCQIIEFAAVVDDLAAQAPLESLPRYQTYIMHDFYIGEPYALSMHAGIFKKLANWKENGIKVCREGELMPIFQSFLLSKCGYSTNSGSIKINVAGKNFASFDAKFLEKLSGYGQLIKVNHRIIDPVMLYFNPKEDKEQLPSSEVCLKRAGINEEVSHCALDDALMVVKLLRKKYPKQL